MELLLKVTGVLLIVLAFIHVFFPKYFNWKEDFHAVSLINKEMMYVHSFFVAFTVLLIGILCVGFAADLIHTRLGNYLALGLCIFWFLRLICQFFVYSSKLWKGKRFETAMHMLFSILWCYLTVIFFLVYYQNKP